MKKILGTVLCLLLLLLLCACAAADEVKLPADLKTIEEGAFMGDASLTSVILPDGLETIGANAFADTGLTAVTIPASVTSIGEGAFAGCDGLEITCERNSVAEAYAQANGISFASRSPATDFTFTALSENTCEVTGYTGSDRDLVIPAKDGQGRRVTSIGEYAFCQRPRSLKSVTIPYGVTSIGDYAFALCSGLTSVSIPASMVSIGESAFHYCESLTGITIPDGTVSIGSGAFYNCSSLTSITIPASVNHIGDAVFRNCSGLTNSDVSAENAYYTSIDGVLFDKSLQTIICYPAGRTAVSYAIPSGVTSIGNGAFFGSESLKEVIIPDSVTSICNNAFAFCGLSSITIPDSVTSIGLLAFWSSNLTSITIPESVTSIGWSAFLNCSKLVSITIPPSVTSIGEEAFNGCENLAIFCPAGSAAETYAIEHNIPYTLI